MRRISEMEWVTDIFQLGLHGMGSALTSDVEEALAAGHVLVTEREIHAEGMQWVLDQIPDGADYLLTIDYDGFDVTCCPAVSHPEPGGLTYHEGVELLTGLTRKGRIVGMDWAELVPEHDYFGLTARTTGRLILTMINAMIKSGKYGIG
jgi:agmatinase